VKEFVQEVPENNTHPANITIYIKEATTPKDAVEHVYKLIADIENVLDKKEESRFNGGATILIKYLKVGKFEIPAYLVNSDLTSSSIACVSLNTRSGISP
jgi:hypothetical protein